MLAARVQTNTILAGVLAIRSVLLLHQRFHHRVVDDLLVNARVVLVLNVRQLAQISVFADGSVLGMASLHAILIESLLVEERRTTLTLGELLSARIGNACLMSNVGWRSIARNRIIVLILLMRNRVHCHHGTLCRRLNRVFWIVSTNDLLAFIQLLGYGCQLLLAGGARVGKVVIATLSASEGLAVFPLYVCRRHS